MAREPTLGFGHDAEQRLWRTAMCQKRQLTLQAARLQNQEEFLVDEAHTRLSSSVSDLLGLSAQRMRRGPWRATRNKCATRWTHVQNWTPSTGC